MTQRIVDVTVSADLSPTSSDNLPSGCLRVEATQKIQLAPNQDIKINLTIHNSSAVGRMGKLNATYDAREMLVRIPTTDVYVAPEGKTAIYAIISPLIQSGKTKIAFDVY
jgi:hypothetical protein